MRKFLLIVAMASSFFALFPLSWRLANPCFTHPFNEDSFDPVLLVCANRVEILRWHELAGGKALPVDSGCTFQVFPERQAWIESEVRQLPSPAPAKSSWTVHVKQREGQRQQIDLELLGDGIAGMIYDVQQERVTPFKSRMTGPLGSLIHLGINSLLWIALWFVAWQAKRRLGPPMPASR